MKPYRTRIIRRLVPAALLLIILAAGPAVASRDATEEASPEPAIEALAEAPEPTPPAYTAADCIACHRLGAGESSLEIPIQDFYASVHGSEITCRDCHTGIVDDTHQESPGSGAVDCAACHDQANGHGMAGAAQKRPACYDCHTRHNMRRTTDPASSVHPDNLPATCAGCHPDALPKQDLFSWLPAFKINSHNKADFGSAYDLENCVGCHQGAAAHGEAEPIDGQECRKCHGDPGAAGAMWGYMHPRPAAQPATFAAAATYPLLVIVVLVLILRALLDRVFDRIPGKSKP